MNDGYLVSSNLIDSSSLGLTLGHAGKLESTPFQVRNSESKRNSKIQINSFGSPRSFKILPTPRPAILGRDSHEKKVKTKTQTKSQHLNITYRLEKAKRKGTERRKTRGRL